MKILKKALCPLAALMLLALGLSVSAAGITVTLGGISSDVTAENKYVSGEITIEPLSDSDCISLIEGFEAAKTYEITDSMEVLSAFKASGEGDFSGTLTQLSVSISGGSYPKALAVHRYEGGIEAIPISGLGGEAAAMSFNTSYGLGEFILLGVPAESSEALGSESPEKAESPGSEAAPQNTALPSPQPQVLEDFMPIVKVAASIVIIIAASSFAVIIVSKRKNKK